MREQDTGQLEVRGGLCFCIFYKGSIRIYRRGRLHEDEGARVFPVNNIILKRAKYLLHLSFSSL